MKEFKEYYNKDQIIKQLCKIRIKYANKRYKKYLLDKLTKPENYLKEITTDYDEEIIKQLDNLLPKRRLWLSKGQRTYKTVINKQTNEKEIKKIDKDEKNREILYNTTKKYLTRDSDLEFVVNLKKFIKDIQNEIESETFKISKPDIIPEIKESNYSKQNLQLKKYNAIECRPISRFLLRDRIVISITNKFLTELFDDFFEANSLAFRAIKDSSEKNKTHHLAIERIIEYKNDFFDKILYVAECDMKKFYDTVNHRICEQSFYNLIEKAKIKYPNLKLDKAIYLFKEYLNCYNFKDNIKILNTDFEYWKNQKDTKQKPIKGFFNWVEEDIKNNNYYRSSPNEKIGVPQGGALSGLIANIILDNADKALKEFPDLLYLRYCDDMIIMHHNKEICKLAIDKYTETINELLLFNHTFINNYFTQNKNRVNNRTKENRGFISSELRNFNRSYEFSLKPYWNSKSKGPYKWGEINKEDNCIPWLGFVGYEINYKCETRIRKRSLKKEIDKQKKVVTSIIKRIHKVKNARNNTIYKSALEKLIGMSVGRVNLYDYSICQNKICWTDGFQSLNFNKYSRIQLKALDRNKYKYLNILTKHLGEENLKSKVPNNNEEIVKMKKPYSYYYQAGEKKIKNPNSGRE